MDVLRSALERFGRRAPVSLKAHEEIPKAEKKLREIERETGKRPEGRLPDFLSQNLSSLRVIIRVLQGFAQ